jgi:hypothetical protein
MSTARWKSSINGNFVTSTNWRGGSVPSSADNVLIQADGNYTVTSQLNETIAGLNTAVGTTIHITAGAFSVGKGNTGAPQIFINGDSLAASSIAGTILVDASSGFGIADRIVNTGDIEALGNGRFTGVFGSIVLEPYGNSINSGTINAAGGQISIYLADTSWTDPLGFSPTHFVNSGLIEATANGLLGISSSSSISSFTNTGRLAADGGLIEIDTAVNGKGSAIISNGGELDIRHAGFGNDVVFSNGSYGTLGIMFGAYADDGVGSALTGTLSGLGDNDLIILYGMQYGSATNWTYSSNAYNTGGDLQISDGSNDTTIHLIGSYSSGGFHVSDLGYGIAVTYSLSPPTVSPAAAILNDAIHHLSELWGNFNCAGFVYTVSFEADPTAGFFDPNNLQRAWVGAQGTDGIGPLLNTDQNAHDANNPDFNVPIGFGKESSLSVQVTTIKGVPVYANPSPTGDAWHLIGDSTSNYTTTINQGDLSSLPQPGDLFRGVIEGKHGAIVIHSGVVSAYDASTNSLWLISNWEEGAADAPIFP